jgi:RNA polymerase sigma-70 factor (ECF subfamily)
VEDLTDKLTNSDNTEERGRRFVQLLAACERRLYDYIFALVGNFADADEIAQDTKLRLWEQFDQFEPGTNFAAWACTIARYRILDYRKMHRRERALLSEEFCQRLSETLASQSDELGGRRLQALQQCLQRISPDDRELLMQCYASHSSVGQVAAAFNKTRGSLYQRLWRIRGKLLVCIERRMAEEG